MTRHEATCRRCNQPRPDLSRGLCQPCRAHTCTIHPEGRVACYKLCGCRCRRCGSAYHKAEQSRRWYAAKGEPRRVDATGTIRRIRAMWAMGWTSDHIATLAGMATGKAVWQVAGNRRWVTPETAEAISTAYRTLAMRSGPSAVTAARARRDGYLPALAWDNIDDPNEQPNLTDSTPTTAERIADAKLLEGTDTADSIARRLGWGSVDSMVTILRRHGQPALALRYERTAA